MFKISNIEIKHRSSDAAILADLLSSRIRSLFSTVTSDDAERIVQVSIRVPHVEPLQWLLARDADQTLFWQSRDGRLAAAGIGAALQLAGEVDFFESPDRLRISSLLQESDGDVRFYGGLRFNAAGERGDEWQAFQAYRFVVPRFELVNESGLSKLVANLVLPADASQVGGIVRAIPGLLETPGVGKTVRDGRGLQAASRHDLPDPAGWRRNVEWSLSAFSRSRLGKVVLARKAVFELARHPDPAGMLERLRDETPNCFHFLFQPIRGEAFLGASPERLIGVTDRQVESEAVAGTRPRSEDETDDAVLRNELLHSEKDQREHQFVRMSIKDTLSGYCDVLHVDNEASEMMLHRGRHLVSRIDGTLQRNTDLLNVLRDMHPTAAVGGYPTQDAIEIIEGLEPFDRGWYAGPVGWIGKHEAEFAVAIRSGLISDKTLSLFSGAGIVGGSDPSSEWNEIEQKLEDFIQVFGLDKSSA